MSAAERVLAVWSPDWPVVAAMAAAHVPAHRPAAVFLANRVVACSAGARSSGVRRGLRRREAQARCPEIAVLAPDPDRDARLFEPVVLAVEELAPGVEVVRPGLLVLPAKGPVGFFGGERGAAERLIDQVAARTGVESQVGYADGLFAAVLAARRGVGIEPGRSAEFLAPLGVEELDREPDVDRAELVDLLRRLGLRSLGAFGSLDQADVASRFGADAVLAHRLARGLDPRPPVRRRPPEELAVEIELDPPVERVDAAAFAARALAERLHRTLAGHGLSCTRLGVRARTDRGEELLRVWRCAEPLSPSGTVDRVRWQLDAWLTRGGSGAVVALRLSPEETVTAGALQLGLWGDVGETDERAGRALVRVQALLGPESVVTAVLAGGRDPGDRVRLVPWGDDREPDSRAAGPLEGPPAPEPTPGYGPYPDALHRAMLAHPAGRSRDPGPPTLRLVDPSHAVDHHTPAQGQVGSAGPARPREPRRAFAPGAPEAALRGTTPANRRDPVARKENRSQAVRMAAAARDPVPVWPGRLPAPSPTTVPEEPLPVELRDAADRPVELPEPDLLSADPHRLLLPPHPAREIRGWAGPWPVVQRWWSPDGAAGSRLQVELADGAALLLLHRQERWWVVGIY
ncbi:DNA polymerase Y family protein [Pseudonocardia xishanensis]|uniref:UmuC domain-containing protein n=1 Tax=Pseudonocardia xishanensis TaxID=630995 RepID=A0ABP8S0T6_9PSEU